MWRHEWLYSERNDPTIEVILILNIDGSNVCPQPELTATKVFISSVSCAHLLRGHENLEIVPWKEKRMNTIVFGGVSVEAVQIFHLPVRPINKILSKR